MLPCCDSSACGEIIDCRLTLASTGSPTNPSTNTIISFVSSTRLFSFSLSLVIPSPLISFSAAKLVSAGRVIGDTTTSLLATIMFVGHFSLCSILTACPTNTVLEVATASVITVCLSRDSMLECGE